MTATTSAARTLRHDIPAERLAAVLFGSVWLVLLASGRGVLLVLAVPAAVFLFTAMYRAGRRLAPIATCLVLFAVQNIAAGMLGGPRAESSLHVAVVLSALLPACIVAGAWLTDPSRALHALATEHQVPVRRLLVLTVAYSVLVVACWLTGPFSLSVSAGALRNALTPAYGILIVLLIPRALLPGLDEVLSWLKRWGILVALFGFFELVALGDHFWADVANIGASIHVKKLSVAHHTAYRVPGDFYTFFSHHYFRRLVSVYGDAITTGYYLALAFVIAAFSSRRGTRWLQLGVLGIALGLGFVKGAFQIVLVGVAVGALMRTRARRLLTSGAVIVLLAAVGLLIASQATDLSPSSSSADLHFAGFSSAVRHATSPVGTRTLWGGGIGTGGADAVFIERSAGHHLAATAVPGLDNGAGTILTETGALGLAAVLAMFGALAAACIRRASNRSAAIVAAASVALLFNFLVQEHALTLVASFPFWVLGALCLRSEGDEAEVPEVPEPPRISWSMTEVAAAEPEPAERVNGDVADALPAVAWRLPEVTEEEEEEPARAPEPVGAPTAPVADTARGAPPRRASRRPRAGERVH